MHLTRYTTTCLLAYVFWTCIMSMSRSPAVCKWHAPRAQLHLITRACKTSDLQCRPRGSLPIWLSLHLPSNLLFACPAGFLWPLSTCSSTSHLDRVSAYWTSHHSSRGQHTQLCCANRCSCAAETRQGMCLETANFASCTLLPNWKNREQAQYVHTCSPVRTDSAAPPLLLAIPDHGHGTCVQPQH